MKKISNEELFALMQTSTQMREELTERVHKARKACREACYRAYQEKKIEKEYQNLFSKHERILIKIMEE